MHYHASCIIASLHHWRGANKMNATADQSLKVIPYTATSLSVLGRFIFMFLLYKNKSTNSLSLLFCFLSMISSSMWIYYSVQMDDTPLITRSSTEITLLFLSALYIIKNKVSSQRQVHPLNCIGIEPTA